MKKNYQRLQTTLLFLFSAFSFSINAQTDPAAQSLPYSQNFTALAATSTVYPAGWQGWNISASGSGATFKTNAAISDNALQASSTAATTTEGAHNYSGKIGFLSGATDNALCLSINTTGYVSVGVNFNIMTIRNPNNGSSNTRINQVDLQYRVGTIGNFISVSGVSNGIYQNIASIQIAGVTTPQNQLAKALTLPAACNNQPVVQLRWVQRNFTGTGTALPSFAIDDIVICTTHPTPTISITGPTAFCSADPAVYTATTTNGGTVPSYQWRKNGTLVGSVNPITISGLATGDQVTCTLLSNATCLTATTANSNTITIGTVTSSPVITLQNLSNVTACGGPTSGAINISVSGGTPPLTINWDTVNTTNGPTFAVNVATKTAINTQSNIVGVDFYVDNVELKELTLVRNIQYSFLINGGHPFHISTALPGGTSVGIVTNGQTGAPASFGTVGFRPNSTHPSLLYYPCAAHTGMGWKINITNGVQTEDISHLKVGTYSVSVTDANGCSATAQYTIVNSQASAIDLTAIVNDAQCGGANGSIDLNISGGTAPYTVCWDTMNTVNGNAFAVTVGSKTASNPYFNLGNPACYFINNFEAPALTLIRNIPYSFNVISPGHPWHVSTDPVGGSVSGLVSNGQTGAPNDNGLVTFTPNNTHPSLLRYVCANHQYMGYNLNIANGYCVEDPVGLRPGLYTVIVSDANGCTATAQYSVNDIPNSLSITGTVFDAQCGGPNGSIDLDVSGGTGPYTVCWDTVHTVDGNTFAVMVGNKTPDNPYFNLGNPTCFYINNVEMPQLKLVRNIPYDFNIINPGHTWHVSTDSVGASTANIVTSGQTGAPQDNGLVTFTPNSSHPSLLRYICGNHQYMGYNIEIVDGYCIEDPVGLKPGLYTVMVTDANGCTGTSQFSINDAGNTLAVGGTVTNVSCSGGHNGSIDLNISGGTGPYTACWDTINTTNPGMFDVTFGPKTAAHPLFGQGSANGYIIDGVEGKELSLIRGLPYSFNVLTPNHPFRITTDIVGGSPNNVVSSGQTGAPTTNGIVTFTPDNTHPSLLYYSCEFHQYMGYNVNILNGYCVEDPVNLKQGTYNVIVTDANGCTVTTQFTVNEPPPISLSAVISDVHCTGEHSGSIDLSVSGGTGPYTICWDTINTVNGNQFGVTFGPKTAAHPLFGQGSANGYIIDGVEGKELFLTRGIPYSFNVLAANHPFRITTDLAGGTTNNVVSSGQVGAPTTNGTVTFTPNQTHPSLLYYSCQFHQFMGYNANIVNGYCTEDPLNLKQGTYTVSVTDANGCTATASYTVNEPPPISLSAMVNDVSCTGLHTGSIDLSVSGGTAPYTICWDTINTVNGNQFGVTFGPKTAAHPLFGQGSANGYIIDGVEGKELFLTRGIPYSFNVLAAGHPFRITTDLAGGTTNNVVSSGQVGAPTTNGTVTFTPNQTHPSLLYYSCQFHQFMGYNANIVNGYCTEDPVNLKQGTYTVSVTDANGCTATASYTVNEPPELILSATVTDANCTSYNGAIDLTVSGGTGPYSICWDTTNTSGGNQFGVTFGPKTAAHPLFGQGSANGYIVDGVEGKQLFLTRGIPYSFNVLAAGHPFRITTDLAGGTTNNVVSSGQTGAPTTNGLVTFTPNQTHPSLLYYSCQFHQFMGYNVNIVNGYCTEDLANIHSGSYTVVVQDANGCTATATYSVGQIVSQFEICGNNIDDNCNGQIDEGCIVNSDLNVKLYIEGYYLGGGVMQASPDPINNPTLCDTITVELADANSPHAILYSKIGTINTNGNGTFQFNQALSGQSYYIVIRHRNALETWSANPVLFSAVTMYDFTTSQNQAFGGNMSQTIDNLGWAIYSGDISSAFTGLPGQQDGIVESQDYSDMENAVTVTLVGYIPQDITGDGIVESMDYSLMENNVVFIVSLMRP